ncbi:MAG: translation initiation factor IF-2 [Spirochaetaceae bacterium]|jgi:translation initiation factor IF-2|nr:translation initiation factor IF-2 [Spirochaetaceae bacterium]
MTEELEKKQEKAELIKKHEQEASEGGVKAPAETGERPPQKKVIKVKKRPAAASDPGAPAYRKKIVAAAPPQGEAAHAAPKGRTGAAGKNAGKTPAGGAPEAAPAPALKDLPSSAAAPVPPASKESTRESHAPKEGKGQEQAPRVPPFHRGVSSFPATPRPNAAAGKVGGKFVGPRHQRDEGHQNRGGSGQFRPRPNLTGGRPPNKGPGPRNAEGGQPGGQRNFSSPGGGLRPRGKPPFQGNQRPGGGFNSPRPGGVNRPIGGRPPVSGGAGPAQNQPMLDPKGTAKKTFKAKKPVYTRREKELEMEEKLLQTKKKASHTANPVPKTIDIMEVVSVSELARKMNLKASDLIQKLMSMGMMVTINEQIDADTATLLAAEFGAEVRIISLYDETLIETGADKESDMASRPPVVTVMGHVDHGKTKLLDAIRSSDVAAGEFGGITQHIGAYIVDTPNGKITFLDTPGHEAFTRMRARGAQVTDIVVLVVAADDGVMPQTIEAVNHAKEANVPIIVAVNKIDKPEANPDRVKSQLSELSLQPEEWGGQTMFVELSALRKEGLDKLIDSILLQAEILDLKANYNRKAEGRILESRIDHGRGTVATVMVQKGTLKIGDSFVAGVWPGKVRALFNDKGGRLDKATPAMPIEVVGFEGIPNAGDPLQVVEDEKTARSISAKRQELKRFEDAKHTKKITLDNLYDTISDGAVQELKVIIKADVQGSAEALRSSLEKLSNKEVRLNVIQALPGAINEGDVDLAVASNAIIIGFNVRPVPKAKALADQEKVDIRKYNVIYKAVEEIQQALEGMLKPDAKEEVIAAVEVRQTFKTPKFGTIAGCYVQTGTVKRNASVHIIRDGIVVHTGKISSLRRIKDDVKEVAAGYECGIGFEGFDGIQENDQLEVFEIVEIARKLAPAPGAYPASGPQKGFY